jgi:hypothetical protein
MEGCVVRKRAVGHENVEVDMPLQKISGGRDCDDDPWAHAGSELSPQVLVERLRAALRQVEKQLAALPEQRT